MVVVRYRAQKKIAFNKLNRKVGGKTTCCMQYEKKNAAKQLQNYKKKKITGARY